MTRAEIRRERERVARAAAFAQKRTRTAFHIVLSPMPEDERGPGRTFATARSVRDEEDRTLFTVDFDQAETVTLGRKDLRRLVGHEVLHMMLWDLRGSRRAHENACYALQRAIFGEVGEP